MTTFAALAFTLLALCSPALADPAPSRPSFKLRVTVHDGASVHSFRVIVGPTLCATANQRVPERQIEIKACAHDGTHLQLEWYTRHGTSESRGTSAVPVEPGATFTLGNERDAHVEVEIQE
jgi:hypothetical protein